jgi:integrase
MQKGHIFQRHGAWYLRYRIAETVDGKIVRKQLCERLADFNDKHRTKQSVRQKAEDFLDRLNEGHVEQRTLQQFIELSYLPHAERQKRPSTYRGYRNLYNLHVAPLIAGMRIASFRTRDGQRLLDTLGTKSLSHLTLIHVKSFLSGVFSFAKRMGAIDANPMQGTEVPKGKPSEPTHAYSNEEIEKMLTILKGTPRVAVIVAAYTGLSLGELQGLKWQDITENELNVRRTIWHGQEGPPKTTARQDAVPLLPIIADALSEHRKQNPSTTWVFEGPLMRPLDMATLGSKKIKSDLVKSDVEWKGWHPMRRGFATRLHEAGVQDKIIQSLMRHSSLSVTMKHYVKATPAANVEAIRKLNPEKADALAYKCDPSDSL